MRGRALRIILKRCSERLRGAPKRLKVITMSLKNRRNKAREVDRREVKQTINGAAEIIGEKNCEEESKSKEFVSREPDFAGKKSRTTLLKLIRRRECI